MPSLRPCEGRPRWQSCSVSCCLVLASSSFLYVSRRGPFGRQIVLTLVEPPAVLGIPQLELVVAAQLLRGMDRPERVVERLATDRDQVGVARLQNLLGL